MKINRLNLLIMPRLVAELDGQFAESSKLEQAINSSRRSLSAKAQANLPARPSAERGEGRGLGYGR